MWSPLSLEGMGEQGLRKLGMGRSGRDMFVSRCHPVDELCGNDLEETGTFAPTTCSEGSRKALCMAQWLLEAVGGLLC